MTYLPKKVTLIGAGNVGFHLGKILYEKGFQILEVYSRTKEKAVSLANQLDAKYLSDLSLASSSTDLVILAVSDDAVSTVSKILSKTYHSSNPLIVHTSGATSSTILAPFFHRFGVFYPLQSFSRDKEIDFSNLPICVHAIHEGDLQALKTIAQKLTSKVYSINDQQRQVLHVAAVVVNNFTNHLYHLTHQLTQAHQVPFELLLPLIRETANKLEVMAPHDAQTGPAIRGDQRTIAQHLEFLEENDPELAKIYKIFTQSIQR